MKKQAVALIALFAGWILTADIANATTPEDIAVMTTNESNHQDDAATSAAKTH